MCKVNGDGRVRFGTREWLGLIAISLTTVAMASALMWTLVGLRIELALAEHSIDPHPITDQRLGDLEDHLED